MPAQPLESRGVSRCSWRSASRRRKGWITGADIRTGQHSSRQIPFRHRHGWVHVTGSPEAGLGLTFTLNWPCGVLPAGCRPRFRCDLSSWNELIRRVHPITFPRSPLQMSRFTRAPKRSFLTSTRAMRRSTSMSGSSDTLIAPGAPTLRFCSPGRIRWSLQEGG